MMKCLGEKKEKTRIQEHKRKAIWIGYKNCLKKLMIEEKIVDKRGRGRRGYDLWWGTSVLGMICVGDMICIYEQLKKVVQDRPECYSTVQLF